MLTLRRKFSILLATLGASVLAVQLTAIWAISTLERELAWPMRSMESVLQGLHQTKRDAEDLATALGRSRWTDSPDSLTPSSPDRARVRELADNLNARLAHLDASDSYLIRSGIGSTRTLRRHIEVAAAFAFASLDDPTRVDQTIRSLVIVHELIERIEGHVLQDAALQTGHAEHIRRSILIVSCACLAALGLTVYLGAILFRRWVLEPVRALRAAAEEIGRGDYEHRIPVRGSDELAMLSAEVNEMASTISKMTQERVQRERLAAIGEMVQRVAHNLRNPLAGIRSLAEVTRSELPPASDLRDVQGRIMETVDRFEGWLKDLIRSTRPLDLEPTPLDLASWLPAVVEPLRPMAGSRRIDIHLDIPATPVMVRADARHLEQAVIAILTNAIQASPSQSGIDVAIGRTNGTAHIQITDRGPGIPADLRERIFQPYFTSKPDGTGIGLALAMHVVQQHRGQITVGDRLHTPPDDDSASRGAVFSILLPSNTE